MLINIFLFEKSKPTAAALQNRADRTVKQRERERRRERRVKINMVEKRGRKNVYDCVLYWYFIKKNT